LTDYKNGVIINLLKLETFPNILKAIFLKLLYFLGKFGNVSKKTKREIKNEKEKIY